ncbi:ribonuclease R [Deinococcus sp. Leaf326]|nr:ribonuclease R [Deinococcus sp. Leaf326]KQR04497.1 ribonuclease R [Deinococcus sp. Leaf326]
MPRVKKAEAAQDDLSVSADSKPTAKRDKSAAPASGSAAATENNIETKVSKRKKSLQDAGQVTPEPAVAEPSAAASDAASPTPRRGRKPKAELAAPGALAAPKASRGRASKAVSQPEATEPAAPKPRRGRRAAATSEAVAAEAPVLEEAVSEFPLTETTQAEPLEAEILAAESVQDVAPAPEPQVSELAPAEIEPDLAAADPAMPNEQVARPARRGRKPKAEAEAAPAEVAAPVPAEDAPPARRRGRRPAQAAAPAPEVGLEPADTAEGQAVAEGSAGTTGADLSAAGPDPIVQPVPRRGRRKKTEEPAAPLSDVLAGVEAVEAVSEGSSDTGEEAAPAAVVVATPDDEPVVDTPQVAAELEPEPEPAPLTRRRGRKARAEAEAAAMAPAPVAVPEAELAEAEEATPEKLVEAPDENAEDESLDAGDAAGSTGQPEQALVVAQLRKLGRPVHVRDLERTFTRQMLERLGNWRDLESLLETLVEDGTVVRTRRRTYGLPEAMSLVRGRFQASAAGFGFVIPDSGGEDYYVPEGSTLEAWNGDTVLVRMEGRGDSREDRGRGSPRRGQRGDGNPRASVVRIVQRAYSQLVGTLEFHHGHPILKPDDHRARHRILLLPDGLEELEAGARVVTELYWPEATGEDEVFGQVARVLGAEDDPETETEAVIVKYDLRGEFPQDVLDQANAIPTEIPGEALNGRLDLREFNIFTVDGRDAKDFDDAIHIQPTPEGTFVVGVHIADVSHYVAEGTPLDKEAYARATSVYLPGRVLPMLPEHLSNGVCSLVPYQDRLTMTAMIELSAEGEILKVQLTPSVINSKARLTYDEVQAYSEATATLPDHARHLEGDLHLLLKITSKLRQKRLREGSLDFKMREVKVDVGKGGKMELIPIREETARGMIEDLMLLANKVVAHELLQREIPTLFRIHEEPTLQRFQDVSAAIGRMGLAFPGGEPTPQSYQAVLKGVRGTPRESVVNTLLLRSMQQAKYAGENLGHFGLAFGEYLHFTSPIRRYPDLVVHRTMRGVLSGELKAGNRAVAQLQGRLPGMGEHTSARERSASEAERDLTKYYQAKWAQAHLGESFAGTVSGVVASGLFVALDNGVEGKLHISHLSDDYYIYLEDAQILKGRSRGRSFRLGDSVEVTISSVKPLARQTDFTLADPTDPDYTPGTYSEENDMDTNVKPRARRREDREQEKREKLQSLPATSPRKFTLDDGPAIQSSPQAAARQGFVRAPQGGRGAGRSGGRGESGGREGGRTFGGMPVNGASAGRGSRRVITLERPRNEHLRPVNITVQRMYFGDWTLENMPPEEGQGGPRAGRERGYNRDERPGGERARRNYTRGGNDRGAVSSPNGAARPSREPSAPSSAPAQATASAAGSEQAADGNRRRRRRGRRSGPGGTAQD